MLTLNRWPLMDDEPEATGGAAQEEAPEGQPNPDGRDEPEATKPEEKTLTQAEVNAIVAREKKKAEKAAKEAFEQERKKAEMSEAEKAQARTKELEEELATERANAKRERTLRTLTGKVIDAEDALVIAERLDLVDDEGTVDVPALLKAKPYLAPKQAGGDVDLPGSRSVKGQHADVAALEAELGKARTRTERIALQRRINEVKKGK